MQVQRCSNVETADVKRCRGAEVHKRSEVQYRRRCSRGAVEIGEEVRRTKYAEVQRCRCRGAEKEEVW